MGSDLMPGSSQAASEAFNLAAFARAYTLEPVTADPPTVTQRLSLAARGLPISIFDSTKRRPCRCTAGSDGFLDAAPVRKLGRHAVRELRCDSFQLPRTRVKSGYYPPLAHQLAAHRLFRDLSSETGR
ncbi:hypothetical protein PF011_g4510 [Phytophthora fragariae]|uniref:Uncharacterized protein n=1 Tax=Phytophthora fragariae TaxID=53985 RepID=A0A6A3LT22_9STRA|nr:hypothetical protein PF011_g4510 [Phytophthora fragariae]